MKEYKDRSYRKAFSSGGRVPFTAAHKKSDLWVAVDKDSYTPDMPGFCAAALERLWGKMEAYLASDPRYAGSLVPCPPAPGAPGIFHKMSAAARKAGIGPMGAVAGAVAVYIAGELTNMFGCREILIENGGDIYAVFREDLDIAVFAGGSPLSEKVGLHIPASYSPLGICTSSGTVGPSLSFGKADAVMVVCRDVLLADSYATAFANKVKTAEDVGDVAEQMGREDDIFAGMVIMGDKFGVVGEFELVFFD